MHTDICVHSMSQYPLGCHSSCIMLRPLLSVRISGTVCSLASGHLKTSAGWHPIFFFLHFLHQSWHAFQGVWEWGISVHNVLMCTCLYCIQQVSSVFIPLFVVVLMLLFLCYEWSLYLLFCSWTSDHWKLIEDASWWHSYLVSEVINSPVGGR